MQQVRSVITTIHRGALVLTLTTTFVLVLLTVVLRFLPGLGTFGLAELITLSAAYLYFLGVSYNSYSDEHITVDMVSTLFQSKTRIINLVDIFGRVVTLIVLAIYGGWGLRYCWLVASMNQKTLSLGFPRIILIASIAIGFILMIYYTVDKLASRFQAMRTAKRVHR